MFFLLTILATTLYANEEPKETDYLKRDEADFRQLLPFNVNPVTGEYNEMEEDLLVSGIQPLSFRRFYNHLSKGDLLNGHWDVNPESLVLFSIYHPEFDSFVGCGQRDGSFYRFDQWNGKSFQIAERISCTHDSVSGGEHPSNTHVECRRVGQERVFGFAGKIVMGNGGTKEFITQNKAWPQPTACELSAAMQTKVKPPYIAQLTEERLPNGNILRYEYLNFNNRQGVDPAYFALKGIKAYDRTGKKLIGELKVSFSKCTGPKNLNTPSEVLIEGSDGRQATYFLEHRTITEKNKSRKQPYCFDAVLSAVQTPHKPMQQYGYQWESKRGKGADKKIEHYEKYRFLYHTTTKNGIPMGIAYDKGRRVQKLLAPSGPKGEERVLASYSYASNSTKITDAVGNETIFYFDNQKRVTAVENGDSIKKREWGAAGDLIKEEVCNKNGESLFSVQYIYDKSHNRIEESSLGHIVKRRFDDQNRVIEEIDGDLRKTYRYDYSLVTEESVYDKEQLIRRISNTYDEAACLVRSVVESGPCKRITEIEPKRSLPNYGLPHIVREKDGNGQLLSKRVYSYTAFGAVASMQVFDCHDNLLYVTYNEYDEKERLICATDPLGQKSHFSYDERNNLIRRSVGGHTVEVVYDAVNRPISFIDGELKTSKSYNALGQLIKESHSSGFTRTFEYDCCGRLSKVSYPDGSFEMKSYDPLGNVIEERDRKGYITKRSFNGRSQPLSVVYPDGSSECFAYDNKGRRISYRNKNGLETTYVYDALDRVIEEWVEGERMLFTYYGDFLMSVCDRSGFTTNYSYDSFGRKIKEEREGRAVFFEYDSAGRLSKRRIGETTYETTFDHLDRPIEERTVVNGQVLRSKTLSYDVFGNCIATFDSKGKSSVQFNFQGQKILEVDPLGNETHYIYRQGLLVEERNPALVSTFTEYDSCLRPIYIYKRDRLGTYLQGMEQEFDANGNCVRQTHHLYRDGRVIKKICHQFEFGPCDRREAILEGGKRLTRYFYDESGRLKTLVRPSGSTIEHEYDVKGRLIRKWGRDFDYRYSYDKSDRLVLVLDERELTVTRRGYNAYGELTFECLASGATLFSDYNELGCRTQLTLPDETAVSFSYVGDQLSGVQRGNLQWKYERDLDGKITRLSLPLNLGCVAMERDKLSRPTKIAAPFLSLNYEYDACGNVISENGTRYFYDGLNQLIRENECEYGCDSLGNRGEVDELCQMEGSVYDSDGNLLLDGYSFDSLGRLIGSPGVTYGYDSFDRRIWRETSEGRTYFIWDGENEIGSFGVCEELRILGEGLGAEIGAALLWEMCGERFFPLHDHRGSVRRLLRVSREPIRFEYSAFGESDADGAWTFCSKRREPETGLIYFGRRYYVPSLGVWLTPDPAGLSDGPNVYCYVHHNPHYLDLYGLKGEGFWNAVWKSTPLYTYCRAITDAIPEDRINPAEPTFTSLSERGYAVKSLPKDHFIIVQNGMRNNDLQLEGHALHISNLSGGYDVMMFLNPTNGYKDFFRVGLERLMGKEFKQVGCLKRRWESILENPDATILHISTSEGSMQSGMTLELLPRELRERISCLSIAPAVPISPNLCRDSRNVMTHFWRDPVPMSGFMELLANRNSITLVKSHPDAPWFDHSISSPTYEHILRERIESYILEGS